MARTKHADPDPTEPEGDAVRRRRPLLFTITALGAVIGLLGLAGVFATGSDRATTGQNDAISGEIPSSPTIDLELATGAFYPPLHSVSCGRDWSDDLTTTALSSDGQPIDSADRPDPGIAMGAVCIRNDGDVPVAITASAFNVVDTELACSPGEAEAGDATCGDGAGELSQELDAEFTWSDGHFTDPPEGTTLAVYCQDEATHPTSIAQLADGTTSVSLGTLVPGEIRALCIQATDSVSPIAQTDQVTWQFAFDGVEGVAPPAPCDGTDAFEPNNGQNRAQGDLEVGQTVEGVSCANDPDWFNVASLDQGTATFTLDWTGSANLDLVAYGNNGVLAEARLTTGNHEELTLSPFDVFDLQVTSDATVPTPYTLSLVAPSP